MAKLFKKSTFLFVFLGLLFLAKDHGTAAASPKEEIAAASAASAAGAAVGATAKAGVEAAATATSAAKEAAVKATAAHEAAVGAAAKEAAVKATAAHEVATKAAAAHEVAAKAAAAEAAVGTGAAVAAAEGATAVDGCACNDKVSEFLNKVLLILRYYTSKELGPELEALAVRFVEFFFSHLAAEKPEAMAKIHGFLQNSVQVTSAAVTKVAKA